MADKKPQHKVNPSEEEGKDVVQEDTEHGI